MEIHGKKLDDARVAIVREKFERNRASHGTKGLLTFDQLLDRFAMDCNLLSGIAREHGVTHQAIQQLYERYFRDLFPGSKSGYQRRVVCAIKRSKIVERDLSVGGLEPWVEAIVAEAQKNGLSVRRCKGKNRQLIHHSSIQSFKKKEFFVNGKHCVFHLVSNERSTSANSKRLYGSCQIRNLSCKFIVVWQQIEKGRIFIIPVDFLKKLIGQRRGIQIWLPVEREISTYKDAIDWWQYENAWHLFQ